MNIPQNRLHKRIPTPLSLAICLGSLCFSLLFFLFPAASLSAASPIKAQIGVLGSGGGMSYALKNRQKVSKSDQFQLQVEAQRGLFLYLVIDDGKMARLQYKKKLNSAPLYLPSKTTGETWLSGASKKRATFFIVLSKKSLPELERLKEHPVSSGRWRATELRLLQSGRPGLSGDSRKPSPIAANMRSLNARDVMRKYIGKEEMLAVKYTLHVAR